MSRVQLALNVDDLDAAITFYSNLFGVAPAKPNPGYANLAVTGPLLIDSVDSAECACATIESDVLQAGASCC